MSSDALPCDDFLQSARLLNLWRKSDDHVRYELNSELPTASFVSKVDYASKCNTFVNKMLMSHEKRTKAIRDCIKLSTEKLVALQRSSELSNNECNMEVTRDIQKRQLLLRQFQTELLNEEVIQTSAFKVIYERCREHFRHPVFDKFRDYDL
ncbi:Coiled-coil domain-containing protein 58 [Schistosoma haematobium]|uniref:Protein MIX23 n=2 Tax=Schistosoma haematobium TaxID=6185 RepID=A0A6A5DX34_SCHHA|nr:Coiled-coil domain-containing protein 58 [Schistosoma haematobium]KAH9580267.1 Coiled-coil domain-containing protein 58 [Schistosoma haematobium]CAH8618362.1 unnamed protein product [Schistosoma haematobium]